MAKKPLISPEEQALFRAAVADVKTLDPHDKATPQRRRKPARPLQREQDDREVLHDMLSDPPDDLLLETGEELLYSRPGLQTQVMRKLRRGQFAIEAELDLHRMTRDEAAAALQNFLTHCQSANRRCVRIIHGKGNRSFNKLPVLKGKLDHWLRQRDEVLAFCSARPVDGGTGAVYVLLRNLKATQRG